MFWAIKRNTLILCALAFVLIVSAALILVFGMNADTSAEDSEIKGTVVIDPGHGGPDGGASSGDVQEKDLNLSVALKLRDILGENGYAVVMTRETDDIQMGENGKYSKKADLSHRMDVLNSANSDVFISIHMNKFTDPKYSGAQVFSSDNGDESKRLGEAIQASLKNNLDNSNTRAAKGNERNVYILRNAKGPAVLVECGFLSNADELQKLTDEEYQKKLAEAIQKGMEDYLSADSESNE